MSISVSILRFDLPDDIYYNLSGAFTRPVALRLTLLLAVFLDVVVFRFAGRLFIGFCSSPSPPNFNISIAPCLAASFQLYLFVKNFLAALMATFIARFPAAFKIFFLTGTMARLIIGAAIRKRPRNSPPIPCPRYNARPRKIVPPMPYPF